MTKNIYLPKENIPKIEETREIENEIPTYEEFLNKYNQEQVNYSDLVHEDINSSKGYGPCSYSNPNCTCYVSQGFIQLYIPCPAVGCSNGNDTSTWIHSRNGYLMTSTGQNDECGVLLISNQGQIRCVNCGTSSHFSNWNFNCHDYRHGGYHKKPNANTFLNALSMTGGSIRNRSPIIGDIARQLTNYLFTSL